MFSTPHVLLLSFFGSHPLNTKRKRERERERERERKRERKKEREREKREREIKGRMRKLCSGKSIGH